MGALIVSNLETLLSLIWSFVPSKCLEAAIKIDLFTKLDRPDGLAIEELESITGISKVIMRRFLRVFLSLGLVQHSSDQWYASDVSKRWLSRRSIQYLGDFVLRGSELNSAYSSLPSSLQGGCADPQMLAISKAAFGGDEFETNKFAACMESMSSTLAEELSEIVDLCECRHFIDIGSGWGIFARVLAQKWPRLECTLVDLPMVAKRARKKILDDGLDHRITVVESDWFEFFSTFNIKADAILLSQVLHELPYQEARRLLELSCSMLHENGVVMVVEFLLHDDSPGPLLSTVFDLNMLVEVGGQTYSSLEIQEMMRGCGVRLESSHTLSGGRSLIVGCKTPTK